MTVTVIFLRYEVKDSEKNGILRRRLYMYNYYHEDKD